MKASFKIIAVIIILFSFNNLFAQEKKLITGNSVAIGFPVVDMAETYDLGIGFYLNVDYNFTDFLIGRFDFGWNSFSGPDGTDPITGLPIIDVQQDVWEFTAGMRVKLSVFYVEARGGYFTGVNSWGYVPAIGLRFGKLDIQGNLTVAGNNGWYGARVGYYWGNK